MKVDKMVDNITIKPEEFRLKDVKNQKNSIMLHLNDCSIEPRKIFFYNDLDELAFYPFFLDCLYCNDNVTCLSQDIKLEDLRKHFVSFEQQAIETKIKVLFDIMHFEDNIGEKGLKEKIRKLELKLKTKNIYL